MHLIFVSLIRELLRHLNATSVTPLNSQWLYRS